jgi:hypothetical protein
MHGNKIHRKKSQESKIITSKAEELDSGNSFLRLYNRYTTQHSYYLLYNFLKQIHLLSSFRRKKKSDKNLKL